MTQVCEMAPCGGDEYARRLEVGVTERIGDRLACAAGFHPHEVWPQMLDDAIADLPDKWCPECDCLFIPSRPSVQRFCSKRCYGKNAWRERAVA